MRFMIFASLLLGSSACAPKHLNLGMNAPAKVSPDLGDKAQVVITRTRKTGIALPYNFRFGKEAATSIAYQDCVKKEVAPGNVQIRAWMGTRVTRVMFTAEAGKTYYFDGHDALGFPTNNAALNPKTPEQAAELMKKCKNWY